MDTSKSTREFDMMTDSASTVTRHFVKADLVLFAAQVILLFIVVVTSLVNLSLENGNTNLWTMILTSCIGYMLPNPRLKVTNGSKGMSDRSSSVKKDGVVLRDTSVERPIIEEQHSV